MTISLSEFSQNSPEWYEWRKKGIGGSDVPAVLGICPWKTPYDIWLSKTNRAREYSNSATRHGHETEGKARARYELIAMEDMRRDICAVHPKYEVCRVSLDGIRDDGRLILEIKCPKSRITIDEALLCKVPDHYTAQIQYQLAVTGADECHFFVYHEDSDEHALVSVTPDIEYQGRLIAIVLDFWAKHVLTDSPPPLTNRDVKVVEGNAELAELCRLIEKNKDSANKKQMNEWKAMAVMIANHPKFRCGNVQISTVQKNGKFSFHKLTITKEVIK